MISEAVCMMTAFYMFVFLCPFRAEVDDAESPFL
jgi:hypothetical protein